MTTMTTAAADLVGAAMKASLAAKAARENEAQLRKDLVHITRQRDALASQGRLRREGNGEDAGLVLRGTDGRIRPRKGIETRAAALGQAAAIITRLREELGSARKAAKAAQSAATAAWAAANAARKDLREEGLESELNRELASRRPRPTPQRRPSHHGGMIFGDANWRSPNSPKKGKRGKRAKA